MSHYVLSIIIEFTIFVSYGIFYGERGYTYSRRYYD